MKIQPALNALKLDSIHSIAGHATIEGARTRLKVLCWETPLPAHSSTSGVSLNRHPLRWNSFPRIPSPIARGKSIFSASTEIAKRTMRMYMPPGQQGGPDLIESMLNRALA